MFTVKGQTHETDELQETSDALIEEMSQDIPEEEPEDAAPMAPMETGLREQEEEISAPELGNGTGVQKQIPPEGATQISTDPEVEFQELHPNCRDMLTQAREYLFSVLMSMKFSRVSGEHIVSLFNEFVQWTPEQIPLAMLVSGDDFCWAGQRSADRAWTPLSDIAMRLHCCPCSEAECERTISAQRLILTSRRLHSKKRTIDARLTLMRALEE
jgi:hypothetical protein